MICQWLGWEGFRLIEVLAVLEAVEEHAHEAVEEVALSGNVAVAGFSAAVVVGSGAG